MPVLSSITLFVAVGAGFVYANLLVGRLVRPRLPNPDKLAAYECGEPAIGAGRVQFDPRFYIVALVYLVFDVEVALFYPWAVAYGDATAVAAGLARGAGAAAAGMTAAALRSAALVDLLFFFGVLFVGFAYLWRFGYLDWVRPARERKA